VAASRTDEVRSHQFTMRRVVAAVVTGDPDSPAASRAGALVAGLVLALVAVATVAAVGVLRPAPDTSWRSGDAVIIERESGARFVYRRGRLHPVPNDASALLILGSPAPRRSVVPRAVLRDVPRGVPLGIDGVPDPLPTATDLLASGWTECSRPGPGRGGVESVLLIGASGPVAGWVPLADQALFARDPAGTPWLIWHGHRHAVADPVVMTTAFGWRGLAPTPVAPAVLAAIPVGDDLSAPTLPRGTAGRPSALAGFRVGQVVVVTNHAGGTQFGLVVAAGIADITQVQADLVLADPALGAAGGPPAEPVRLGLAAYAAAPHAPSLLPAGDATPPAVTPVPLRPAGGAAVCASFVDGDPVPELGVTTTPPRSAGELSGQAGPATPAADPVAGAGGRVDWVLVPPGRAVAVEVVPSGPALGVATRPAPPLVLVTDVGRAFPVPSRQVLAMLGLADGPVLRLPAALVAGLATGSALDPVAATAAAP
jgi:type VII secretion protein EccB